MDRPRDILDLVLAEIAESDRQLVADMLAHRGADADLARRGERLEPRRHVDAVRIVGGLDGGVRCGDGSGAIDAVAIASLAPSVSSDLKPGSARSGSVQRCNASSPALTNFLLRSGVVTCPNQYQREYPPPLSIRSKQAGTVSLKLRASVCGSRAEPRVQ
jgi:hypothetical protein